MAVAVVQVVGTGALEGTGGPDPQVQVSVPSIAAGSRLLAFHTRDVTNNATVTVTGGGGSWVSIGYAPSPSGTGDLNGEEVGAWYNDSPSTGTQTVNFNFSGSGEQTTGGIVVELSGAATGSNWLANHQQQAAPGTGTDAVGAAATVTPSVATGQIIGCGFDSNTNGAPNTGTANSPTSQGTFWSWVFSGGVLSARVQSQANAGTSAIASTFTCANGTRGAEDHISWTVWVPEPSATVVQPPPDVSQRLGIPSRISSAVMSSISGAAALLPLAAPAAGKQFYPSYPDPLRRPPVIDRGPSSAPIVPQASTAVGTSFYAQEQVRPRPRLTVLDGSGSGAPVSGIPLAQPITWSVPSPMLIRTPSAADGGGGAISPLNPTFWFPDMPDRPFLKRPTFESPSVLLRALAAATTYTPEPSAERITLRRARADDPSIQAGPALGIQGSPWARDPGDRPAPRRIQFEDCSALGQDSSDMVDLSWARDPGDRAFRRAPAGGFEAPPVLPVYQPQTPSWLPRPADVVVRVVRFDERGTGSPLLALVQATDLSWARQEDRPAARRVHSQVPSFTPQATTVTLSSWGWIPEMPSRPGLRTVVNTFVSAMVPPAIVTALPWGWIPEGPDRGFRRAPNTHQDQPPITVLAMQALGWPAESPQPRQRRPVDGSIASFPGTSPGAVWGWLHDQAHPSSRRIALEHPAQVPPAPQAVAWGWFVDGPLSRSPALRPREDAQAPIRPMAGLPAYWQHWQVGPRAPRPVVSGFNETPILVLVPASLPAMPPGDSPFIVVRSAAALRAALEAGRGMVVVAAGAITVGDLKAIMQEVGAWRAVLTE